VRRVGVWAELGRVVRGAGGQTDTPTGPILLVVFHLHASGISVASFRCRHLDWSPETVPTGKASACIRNNLFLTVSVERWATQLAECGTLLMLLLWHRAAADKQQQTPMHGSDHVCSGSTVMCGVLAAPPCLLLQLLGCNIAGFPPRCNFVDPKTVLLTRTLICCRGDGYDPTHRNNIPLIFLPSTYILRPATVP
jgi:hypothetical protein